MIKINKLFTLIILSFQISGSLFGQGTIGNPYTSLEQASLAPVDGIYHFNISGTTFSTFVEAGSGWLLIASGEGSTTESSYTTTTALTLQSDAILPSSIYTSPLITEVRMNATAGPNRPFDVSSSDITVLTNLQNDRTLSTGTNSSSWSGSGSARLTRGCAGNSQSLSTHIYHACGNTGNMHWQVGQNTNHERIVFSNNTKNDLNLWVRSAANALPIELLEFNANYNENGTVQLDWKTASELNYAVTDENPLLGNSYYRLKQTDFDGQFEYSSIRQITIDKLVNPQILLYPNPVQNQIHLKGNTTLLKEITIYNTMGQDVTALTKLISTSEQTKVIDLSQLSNGIYYIKSGTVVNMIQKQ